MAAAKIVLEPIFEADFLPSSYGFRPGLWAHHAQEAVRTTVNQGQVGALDADIRNLFRPNRPGCPSCSDRATGMRSADVEAAAGLAEGGGVRGRDHVRDCGSTPQGSPMPRRGHSGVHNLRSITLILSRCRRHRGERRLRGGDRVPSSSTSRIRRRNGRCQAAPAADGMVERSGVRRTGGTRSRCSGGIGDAHQVDAECDCHRQRSDALTKRSDGSPTVAQGRV